MLQTNQCLFLPETAEDLQTKVIKVMTKYASDLNDKGREKKARTIATALEQLESCTPPRSYCHSALCQRCLRNTATMARDAILARVRKLKLNQFCHVTYINPAWAKPIGQLAKFDLASARLQLTNMLDSNLPHASLVYGGFDVSHNQRMKSDQWTKDKAWPEHYQPHVHFVVWGCSHQEIEKALPPLTGNLVTGASCIRIEPIKLVDADRTINYVFKNNFYRRVSCPNPHLSPPLERSLRGKEFREVWSWLATKRTNELIILKGISCYTLGGLFMNFQ